MKVGKFILTLSQSASVKIEKKIRVKIQFKISSLDLKLPLSCFQCINILQYNNVILYKKFICEK